MSSSSTGPDSQSVAETQITQFYEGILDRAPDAAGLQAWTAAYENGILSYSQIESDVIASPEAQSNVVPIINLYQAVFDRVPDAAGLQGWVQAYESGVSLETIAQDFVNSAEFQATYGVSASDMASSPDAMQAYVQTLYQNILGRQGATSEISAWANSGLSEAQILVDISTSQEADAHNAAADTQFLTAAGNGTETYTGSLSSQLVPPPVVGQTYTLTTGVDTLTGTAADDTFIGTVTSNSNPFSSTAGGTLNAGDSIDGGAGNNTLNIVDTYGNDTNDLVGVTLKNIQNVVVQNASSSEGNVLVDLTLAPSVSEVVALNTVAYGTDIFTGLATGAQVIASGAGTGGGSGNWTDVDFNYANPTDAVSVGVDGGVNGVDFYTDNGAATAATISSTGAANGTINSSDYFELTDGNSSLTTLSVDAATNLVAGLDANDYVSTGAALTVSGAATSVNLSQWDQINFKTIDASGLTAGGLTIGLGTNTTSFKGGANNNVVTTANVKATAASSINAGTGTGNILVVGAATDLATAAQAALYAGFSTLTDEVAGTVNMSLFTNSAITAENVYGAADLSNLSAAQAMAITVTGDSTPTFAVTGATALNPGTVGLTVNDGATGAAGSSTVTVTPTAANIGTVDLTVANAADIAAVNLTGVTAPTMDLTIAGPGIADVTLGAAPANVTLDGVAGNSVTLTDAGGSNVSLGTSAAQTIDLGATHTTADTITVGADADAVYGTTGSATVAGDFATVNNFTLGLDTLQFTAGAPTALADATTITAAQTGVTGLTASSTNGILAFTVGAADTTNSFQQDIFAAANILDTAGANGVAAFTYGSNTYVVETPSAGGSLATDHVFALAGVTGATGFGTGANHILVG